MLDSRKATGFYRGDAARLVSEAARLPADDLAEAAAVAEAPLVSATAATIGAPAVVLDDPQRPPLSPEPPTNQNLRVARPRAEQLVDEEEPSSWAVGRVVAWILLAPWYVAVAVASVGLDVLIVKDLFGL
jgi:hypothetical protein